uniref:Salivary gland protein 8 n=1 Tax=Anopheles atroparvus TaxID=41427 RepID=A0AAG5DRL8_ANOAO
MSGGRPISRRIVIASAIVAWSWLAALPSTCGASGTKSRPVSTGIDTEFVAIRTSPNRTLLCWAIKLSPTAFVADAECVRRYRRHQIAMIYGDVVPQAPTVRERLRRRLASLRSPQCRHSVPPLVLVSAPAGSDRSSLGQTIRNFIAAYGMVDGHGRVCRECEILGIRRVFRCPVEPGTVVLYNDCLKQIEAAERATMNRQMAELDGWTWQLRRTLHRSLYADLEQRGKLQLEWLKFITSSRR